MKSENNVLTASEFRLVDDMGHVRARLGFDQTPIDQSPDSPMLQFFDKDGNSLLEILLFESGQPAVLFRDRNDGVPILLSNVGGGLPDGGLPLLRMRDNHGKNRIVIRVSTNESHAHIDFHDRNDETVLTLGIENERPVVSMAEDE